VGSDLNSAKTDAAQGWLDTFDRLNLAFTVIFTAELAVNLFVNWLWPFFENGCGPLHSSGEILERDTKEVLV
jgi:hypothetical protein